VTTRFHLPNVPDEFKGIAPVQVSGQISVQQTSMEH
jgi:hypothetical protein